MKFKCIKDFNLNIKINDIVYIEKIKIFPNNKKYSSFSDVIKIEENSFIFVYNLEVHFIPLNEYRKFIINKLLNK